MATAQDLVELMMDESFEDDFEMVTGIETMGGGGGAPETQKGEILTSF